MMMLCSSTLIACYYPVPDRGRSIVTRVCLFVCLTANIYSKVHVRYSPILLPMAMAHSVFGDVGIRYILPVLRVTSYLYIMGQMGHIDR